jgi:hypothetical protein
MIEGWTVWLLVVGVAVGVLVTWLVMVRLPRHEDDVSAAERLEEAAWISEVIERHGGIAPQSLVLEILDLHQAYLASPRQAPLLADQQVPLPHAPASTSGPGERPPGGP